MLGFRVRKCGRKIIKETLRIFQGAKISWKSKREEAIEKKKYNISFRILTLCLYILKIILTHS